MLSMMGAVLVMALSLLNIACSSSSDGIGDGGGNPSPSVTPVVPKPDAGNDLYGVVSCLLYTSPSPRD